MIETPRLKIVPLTYHQLILYIQNDNSLEKQLKLRKSDWKISKTISEKLTKNILPKVKDSSKNYHFHTVWIAISKSENQIVAEIYFKGEPDKEGAIEIGYGTYPLFRNQGFISETISGLIRWAGKQNEIKAITAQTDPSNFYSIRALEKNGFEIQAEEHNNIWWKRAL